MLLMPVVLVMNVVGDSSTCGELLVGTYVCGKCIPVVL